MLAETGEWWTVRLVKKNSLKEPGPGLFLMLEGTRAMGMPEAVWKATGRQRWRAENNTREAILASNVTSLAKYHRLHWCCAQGEII